MQFLLSNAQNIESAIIIAGAIIGGFFALYGSWGKSRQDLQTESDAVSQGLLTNYKETINVQEGKIKDLSTKEVEQGKEIAHLQGQVKVLTDMVALRDPGTKKVFEDAPAAFAAIALQGQAIEKLTSTLEEFLAKVNIVMAHN